MTAKEKVLSVYPMAVCTYSGGGMYSVFSRQYSTVPIEQGNTKKQAWQNALNELIKQQLCTE